MRFTASSVQIAPYKGDYHRNLGRLAEAVERCSADGADLVVFPETCLSGYFLEGGVIEVAVSTEQLRSDLAGLLAKLPKKTDVVLGFYEKCDGNIYNAAGHFECSPDGIDVRHVHRKFFLPTYGVFDEERFVARGRDISAYDTRFGRFSMLICEDIWHSVAPMIAALKGALVIVAIAASPARGFGGDRIASLDRYRQIITSFCAEHGVFGVNSMLVGFEGGKGFSGGSIFADPFGRVIAESPTGEEHILTAEIDLDEVAVARQQSPLIADLMSALEDMTREIDEVNENTCPPK